MKKFTLSAIGIAMTCLSLSSFAQDQGGPDNYGYTWKTSAAAGGPAFNWIDITNIGTEITGLADDNASGSFINLGFDFHYYYSDYNRVKIGSNGWISFNNVGNIAHCFPALPTSGGAENYLAALLSDLNFDGAGNPGKAYYYTNNVDTFIVSYVNVPFFSTSAPDWTGSNTFQIILSAVDSSITYQYGDMNPTFNDNAGCVTELVIGMENVSGQIGFEIRRETFLPDSSAVKIYYPDNVTVEIKDVGPDWNQNEANGGFFVAKNGAPVTFSSNIDNVGNTDVTTVRAQAKLKKGAATTYTSAMDTLESIVQGGDTTVFFTPAYSPTTTGTYALEVTSTLTGDGNTSNNVRRTEMVVVDTTTNEVELTYARVSNATGAALFGLTGSGTGAAVYFEPPFYPAIVLGLGYVVADPGSTTAGAPVPLGFRAVLADDDGPNGLPGTVLATDTVDESETSNRQLNVVSLDVPVVIASGGFYVEFFADSGQLMTETLTPISQRTFEIIGGAVSVYRSYDTQDFLVSAIIEGSGIIGVNSKAADKVVLYQNVPNPATHSTTVAYKLSENTDVNLTVTNLLGQVVEQRNIANQPAGLHQMNLDLNDYVSGIYYYTLTVNGQSVTKKMVIAE